MESLEGALKERLEVYRRSKTMAETEGNSSKVRRYGRICKQFEDALKMHAKGKPVAIDELPTPPGFPPLSGIGGSNAPAAASRPAPPPPTISEPAEPSESAEPPKPKPRPSPSPSRETTPVAPPRTNSGMNEILIID